VKSLATADRQCDAGHHSPDRRDEPGDRRDGRRHRRHSRAGAGAERGDAPHKPDHATPAWAAHAIAADVLAATQEIVLIGQATGQVSLASRNTAGASDAVLKAAGELTGLAQALNARVDHVIGELRVA
jgi:hypothetical protein